MITFTVGKYEVMAFTGKDQPVRLYLYDDTSKYRGYIDYIKDYAGVQNFIVHANGIINAFMPFEKLLASIDLLRNENPVFFSVNQQYNWAALKTGLEPTGDEETP